MGVDRASPPSPPARIAALTSVQFPPMQNEKEIFLIQDPARIKKCRWSELRIEISP